MFNHLELRDKNLNQAFLMVKSGNPKDARRLSLSELRSKNLKLFDNILFKLPVNLLLKWLAMDRLGSFVFSDGNLYFHEGMHRMDIYQPTPGKFQPFEIATVIHEFRKASHFSVINELMKYRSMYLALSSMTGRHLKMDNLFIYENDNEILDVNVRIRLSRKRNRKSK